MADLVWSATCVAFFAEYTQTIERQTEQLRKFSRLVTHEIRQPLAVLQAIARTLPVAPGDLEVVRMMDIFERNVARLSDVTGKLERLARVTPATDRSPSEQETDQTVVVQAVARQLADDAGARDVEVIIAPTLPTVRLDPTCAELVFTNLLVNAIKHSDKAKPRRFVEIYPADGDSPSAHALRHDDVVPRGLGVGLSIVRDCMDAANGSVRVESMAGKGTTFKLAWPLH